MSSTRLWTFIVVTAAMLALPNAARATWNDPLIVPRPTAYDSTTVFHADTSAFPQWTDVMRRAAEELRRPPLCAGSATCVPAEWRTLADEIAGKPLMTQLAIVNRTLNALPYVTAWQNWRRVMYWETPFEFLARGGQCEDYAIAKYLALHAAGIGDDVIRVLIVHDSDLGVDHAVLMANVDGTPYLLDNLNPNIVPAADAPQYQPYYGINLSGYWTYLAGRNLAAANER